VPRFSNDTLLYFPATIPELGIAVQGPAGQAPVVELAWLKVPPAQA
jgi:hypothetical protein